MKYRIAISKKDLSLKTKPTGAAEAIFLRKKLHECFGRKAKVVIEENNGAGWKVTRTI